MNIKEIQEMIKLMQENDIVEFQLERNGLKILLKRGKSATDIGMAPGHPVAPLSQPVVLPEAKEEIKYPELLSPMVGTFYAAPSPEAAPYVQVGQQIQKGDVVCIIEAMKVMNEVKSDLAGTVGEILVENGQPIEFGQPLFKIKP